MSHGYDDSQGGRDYDGEPRKEPIEDMIAREDWDGLAARLETGARIPSDYLSAAEAAQLSKAMWLRGHRLDRSAGRGWRMGSNTRGAA